MPIWLVLSAGVDSGSRLRVRGEGNAGRRGGESGDLYVFISVKDHPELRREGTTIHSDVEISYVDAILGTQVGHKGAVGGLGVDGRCAWGAGRWGRVMGAIMQSDQSPGDDVGRGAAGQLDRWTCEASKSDG